MKKYDILYLDPPWQFNNKNTGGSMKSGSNAQYPTLSLQELKQLDIPSIASNDCVMFMWWVGSQPKEAIELVESWGFTLKTMTGFNWIKLTKLGKLFFGMGFWTRCLRFDTKIYLYDTINEQVLNKNIEYLKDKDLKRFRIWSNDGWKRILNFHDSGIKPTYHIKTKEVGLYSSDTHKHIFLEPINKRYGIKKRFTVKEEREGKICDIKNALNKSAVRDHGYSVDLIFSNTPVFNPKEVNQFKNIKLDREIGWIIGLYLAEGSMHGKYKRGLRFSLHSKEKPFYDRMKKKLDSLNIKYDRYYNHNIKINWNERGSKGEIQFTSSIIANLIREYCLLGNCYTHKIKSFTKYNTPIEFREGIIEGMSDGDGCIRSEHVILRLSNKQLILDIADLCNSVGKKVRYYGKIKSTKFASEEKSGKYHYKIIYNQPKRLHNNYKDKAELTGIKSILKVQDSQQYDITVEGGLFVANNLITHNSGSECCLIATKGRPKPINRGIRSVVMAPAGKHSKKPDEVRNRIVELCGDVPRIELFARDRYEGWSAFGNEVKSDIEL
jgi:N6-adenosine-specific RNA methylase IME4